MASHTAPRRGTSESWGGDEKKPSQAFRGFVLHPSIAVLLSLPGLTRPLVPSINTLTSLVLTSAPIRALPSRDSLERRLAPLSYQLLTAPNVAQESVILTSDLPLPNKSIDIDEVAEEPVVARPDSIPSTVAEVPQLCPPAVDEKLFLEFDVAGCQLQERNPPRAVTAE